MIGALSDADRLLGRLAGEGGLLSNPQISILPFVQREAVLSSKMGGTQATLGELLADEAGAIVGRSPEDLREVGNSVVALEHGTSRLKNQENAFLEDRLLSRPLNRGNDRELFPVASAVPRA